MLHADASRSGELSARSSATRTPSPVALAPADETLRSTPGQSPASGRPPKSRRTTLQGLHKLLETDLPVHALKPPKGAKAAAQRRFSSSGSGKKGSDSWGF